MTDFPEDGNCRRCGGTGCAACDARHLPNPPCAFRAYWHRPRIYRYQVAFPGFRLAWNTYTGQHGSALCGVALVAGRYAYCVLWADAKVVT